MFQLLIILLSSFSILHADEPYHQDVKALVRLRLGPSADQMVQPLLCQVIPSFLVANASMIFIINVHQSLQYQCLK